MKVSFTGINNLYIGRSVNTKPDVYLDCNLNVKHGNVKSTIYKIECTLSDDSNGNDLTYFNQELDKLEPVMKNDYINKENPNKVTMYVRKKTVENDPLAIPLPSFIINDSDVFGMKNDLPLFSIMARITKKAALQCQPNSEARKAYKDVNNTIHQRAVEIIEHCDYTV